VAIPPAAHRITRVMDPTDRQLRRITISGPGTRLPSGATAILKNNEEMVDPELVVLAEAAAYGLRIVVDPEYAPEFGEDFVEFWLEIAPERRADSAFQGAGVELPMELTFTTNAVPPPRYQQTITQRVAHQ